MTDPREGPPDPIRYFYTANDPVVGECYYWSRIPGGLDSWDPANDAEIIFTVSRLPPCPGSPDPAGPIDVDGLAWQIFRSFPLRPPDISLQPAAAGVTGLPSYLSSDPPPAIVHDEVLPDGRVMQVRARATGLVVDWGDGDVDSHVPEGARPFPAGSVTHVYRQKTCDPGYRSAHPSGRNCHPSLESYPIDATYTWTGEYRIGGPWLPLGRVDLASRVDYDVDEIVGVLVP